MKGKGNTDSRRVKFGYRERKRGSDRMTKRKQNNNAYFIHGQRCDVN